MNRLVCLVMAAFPLAAWPFARRMRSTEEALRERMHVLESRRQDLLQAEKHLPAEKVPASSTTHVVRGLVSALESHGVSPAGYRTSGKNGGSAELEFVCPATLLPGILHDIDLKEAGWGMKGFSMERRGADFRVEVKYGLEETAVEVVDLHAADECVFLVRDKVQEKKEVFVVLNGSGNRPSLEEVLPEVDFIGSSEDTVFVKDCDGFYSVDKSGLVTEDGVETVMVFGRKCRVVY